MVLSRAQIGAGNANEGIDFDVATVPHFRGGADVEAIAFWLDEEPVLLSLYRHDDLRGALKGGASGPERGDRRALLERLETVR